MTRTLIAKHGWFRPLLHEDPPKPDDKPDPKPDDKPDAPKPDDDDPLPDDLGDKGKQAIDRMKEQRNAARAAQREAERIAAEQAAKLKAIEDKDKTELERATEAATAATARAEKAERESVRLKVIAQSTLPAELHEFVTGDTEDAMRASATKLADAVNAAPPRQPQPDGSQGPKPDGGPVDFRKVDKAEADAELRKHGVRT